MTKVQILALGRRISEQYAETRPDGTLDGVLSCAVLTAHRADYVKFSTELAHEYVNLGKTARAASIYGHTWTSMDTLRISRESRVYFLLRYAESLIAVGNVLKRSDAALALVRPG